MSKKTKITQNAAKVAARIAKIQSDAEAEAKAKSVTPVVPFRDGAAKHPLVDAHVEAKPAKIVKSNLTKLRPDSGEGVKPAPLPKSKVKAVKESQQSVIFAELTKRATDGAISVGEFPAILKAVKAKFPKGTATNGYIGFVAQHKCQPPIAVLRTEKVKAQKIVVAVKASKADAKIAKAKATSIGAALDRGATVTASATH